MKFFFNFLCLLFIIGNVQAQIHEPVKWSFELNETNATDAAEKELLFKAEIDKGWHLYDMNMPEGGPISTSIAFENVQGAELTGKPTASVKPTTVYDKQFDMNLRWYANTVTFIQKIKVTDNNFSISGEIEFMVCNDETCLPPERTPFHFGQPISNDEAIQDTTVYATATSDEAIANVAVETDLWWRPAIDELKAMGDNTAAAADNSYLYIFLAGFIGGLLALLTPCVWPMIPMTVSFFLKRTKSRRKAINDALLYGCAIICIYVAMGLLITGLFGASALNDLSTNAIFNILFFVLLIVFAVSFFGAFEMVLPSSWTNKMDSKADATSGVLSIFFMAFTLALVSFSCTGPIIGTLLVEAASQGNATPAIGMFGFSLALAIPFALFAIFPNMLQNMPKSGGWLNSVKVTLGFLELALALKFLSVADLAYGWRLLDRETFIVLWIVIFAMLGIYLIGKIRFKHDAELKYVSVPRLFLSLLSFAFAVYMLPGLWGAPLKAISAFAPPLYTQDFNLYDSEFHAQFDNYEKGMEYAAKVGKPVLIDFSGYGCVNCRKMEAAVLTNERVKHIIENDFVLITLMVDDKTRLPQTINITEYGKPRTLKTVGDKWSYLQRSKFDINAQPFYVMLDNKGLPLAASFAFDKNVAKYIQFLEKGKKEYKLRK